MRSSMLFLAGLLLAACAQASNETKIAWSKDGDFKHQQTLAPKAVAEVCGEINERMNVAWKFKADAGLDFNIHYHVGDEVNTSTQIGGLDAADGSFKPPSTQNYCWMWTNTNDREVNLSVALKLQPDQSD
jgi:hypothetical protein